MQAGRHAPVTDGEKVKDKVVAPKPPILERPAHAREVVGTDGVRQLNEVWHRALQVAEVILALRFANNPDDENHLPNL